MSMKRRLRRWWRRLYWVNVVKAIDTLRVTVERRSPLTQGNGIRRYFVDKGAMRCWGLEGPWWHVGLIAWSERWPARATKTKNKKEVQV